MSKQATIEELAIYLPYEVQMKLNSNVAFRPTGQTKPNNKYSDATLTAALLDDIQCGRFDSLSKFKPILHPLSDLSKEIKFGDETIVPIEVLKQIDEYVGWNGRVFTYGVGSIHHTDNLPYNIVRQLAILHFDLHGLIDRGAAIDINTLNQNHETDENSNS